MILLKAIGLREYTFHLITRFVFCTFVCGKLCRHLVNGSIRELLITMRIFVVSIAVTLFSFFFSDQFLLSTVFVLLCGALSQSDFDIIRTELSRDVS